MRAMTRNSQSSFISLIWPSIALIRTGSCHPDYMGRLAWITFCPGQNGFHSDIFTYMPDADQNCLVY